MSLSLVFCDRFFFGSLRLFLCCLNWLLVSLSLSLSLSFSLAKSVVIFLQNAWGIWSLMKLACVWIWLRNGRYSLPQLYQLISVYAKRLTAVNHSTALLKIPLLSFTVHQCRTFESGILKEIYGSLWDLLKAHSGIKKILPIKGSLRDSF